MANEEYKKTFLQADSLKDAKDQLQEVYEANPDAVIIVEEEGKECIIEHDKRLNFVPSGGQKGQLLTSDEEGNPEWGAILDTKPFIVVDTLPDAPAEGNEGKLHLVLNSEGKNDNLYDEYLWVNGKWEKMGTAKIEIDLSNYLTSKQAAQKYYPKVDGENLATQVETLDFTVETLNQGLGEAEQRLTDVEQCNVIAEEVVDENTLEGFEKLTREELKKDLFIDLWNDACGEYGKYNKETGFFELNGLTDITYEEALIIYNEKGNFFEYGKFIKGRTNIFLDQPNDLKYIMANYPMTFRKKFINSPIEILSLSGKVIGLCGNCQQMFEDCRNLKEIKGVFYLASLSAPEMIRMFDGCTSLEIVNINDLYADISFKDSPKIKYSCFVEMIKYTMNTHTITVHPSIYNALIGEDTEYPFNGGTREEWTKLLQDAANKQISFATV